MSKKKQRWYYLSCDVTHVSGIQVYRVKATSEEEAIALHKKGKSEFGYEELEVQSMGEPEVVDIEEIDK